MHHFYMFFLWWNCHGFWFCPCYMCCSEACNKDVPVVLIDMHSCSLDSKIRMNLGTFYLIGIFFFDMLKKIYKVVEITVWYMLYCESLVILTWVFTEAQVVGKVPELKKPAKERYIHCSRKDTHNWQFWMKYKWCCRLRIVGVVKWGLLFRYFVKVRSVVKNILFCKHRLSHSCTYIF